MSSDPSAPPAALEAQLLLDTFRGIDLGVVWLDEHARIVHANEFFAASAGTDGASLAGLPLAELVEDLAPGRWQAIRRGDGGAPFRLTMLAADGRRRVLEVRARPVSHQGRELMALLLISIAERVEAEGIDDLQREVLEAVAVGRPLRSVLDLLCRRVEALAPDVVCSILLIEKNGTLTPIAGPSLPPAYVDALHGAAIGPRAGSCGTAA